MLTDRLKLKRYLGDGVYAGFDRLGPQIWVWTERRGGLENMIAFDAETMAKLAEYVATLKHMAHDEDSLRREQI